MKDHIVGIILSVAVILLVGVLGFGFVASLSNNGGGGVNVTMTSNPQNNAQGNPQAASIPGVESSPLTDSSDRVIGYSARPGDVVITKLIDYDDITTGGVQLFATSTGGFYLENLIIETASSTMASGTAMQVYAVGDTYGNNETVFSTQVSNFPKNTSMDLNTAISTSGSGSGFASSTQRVVLEDQSALYVKCTTASCKPSTDRSVESAANGTTFGFMRFTAILKRLDTGSTIYE